MEPHEQTRHSLATDQRNDAPAQSRRIQLRKRATARQLLLLLRLLLLLQPCPAVPHPSARSALRRCRRDCGGAPRPPNGPVPSRPSPRRPPLRLLDTRQPRARTAAGHSALAAALSFSCGAGWNETRNATLGMTTTPLEMKRQHWSRRPPHVVTQQLAQCLAAVLRAWPLLAACRRAPSCCARCASHCSACVPSPLHGHGSKRASHPTTHDRRNTNDEQSVMRPEQPHTHIHTHARTQIHTHTHPYTAQLTSSCG